MESDSKALEILVTHLHDSVMTELKEVRTDIMNLRIDLTMGLKRIEATLKMHRGMMLAGTVAYQTLTKAVAGFEEREAQRDEQVKDLQARLKRLEERGAA